MANQIFGNQGAHDPIVAAAANGGVPTVSRDPNRMVKCPPDQRLIEFVNLSDFNALTNSVPIYGWNRQGKGLVEGCRQTRNIICIQFIGAYRAKPDPVFDFLHTRFRRRWKLKLLRWENGPCRQLNAVFDDAECRAAFLASWDRGVCPLRASEIDNIIQWPIAI